MIICEEIRKAGGKSNDQATVDSCQYTEKYQSTASQQHIHSAC